MSFGIRKQQPKQGGKIKGKGTGTSDDVQKTVLEGTYIMPADSTAKIGTQNLEQIGQGQPVDVNVSNGEFEMTPEQVHAVGVQALDQMKDRTHTPVDQPQVEGGFGLKKPQLFFANGGVVEDEWKRNLKTQSQPQSGFGAVQPRSGFNQPSTALTDNKNIQFPTAQPKVNTPAVAPAQASTQQVQPKAQAEKYTPPSFTESVVDDIGSNVGNEWKQGNYARGIGQGARGVLTLPGAAAYDALKPVGNFLGGFFNTDSPTTSDLASAATANKAVAPVTKPLKSNAATQQKTNTAPSFNDQLNDAMYGSSTGGQTAQPASTNVNPYAIQQKGNSFSYANPGAAAQARAAGIPELQSSSFAGGITPTKDPQGVKNFMANTREMGPSEQQIQAALNQRMNTQGQGFGAIRQPQAPQRSEFDEAERKALFRDANTVIKGARGLTGGQLRVRQQLLESDAGLANQRYVADANNATSIQNNIEDNSANILQTGMRESGQNMRHAASLGQDNYQFNTDFGLKQRQQNLTEKKEGFGVRRAERAEKLYEMYDRAENDEQRQSIQARINRLTGADTTKKNPYMVVGGGQEWNEKANSMVNRPQQLFNYETGEFLNAPVQQQPVPQAAIDALKSDPKKAAEFDSWFGQGSSAQYLKS